MKRSTAIQNSPSALVSQFKPLSPNVARWNGGLNLYIDAPLPAPVAGQLDIEEEIIGKGFTWTVFGGDLSIERRRHEQMVKRSRPRRSDESLYSSQSELSPITPEFLPELEKIPVAIKLFDLFERETMPFSEHPLTIEDILAPPKNEVSQYLGPLSALQGSTVPIFYGAWVKGPLMIVILERLHRLSVASFDDLSGDQRYIISYLFQSPHTNLLLTIY